MSTQTVDQAFPVTTGPPLPATGNRRSRDKREPIPGSLIHHRRSRANGNPSPAPKPSFPSLAVKSPLLTNPHPSPIY